MIAQWHEAGYRIELFFLSLPSAQFAIERVAQRVKQGGHDIPIDVIERRFASGIVQFEQVYRPLVDMWTLIDSSQSPYRVIDWSERV